MTGPKQNDGVVHQEFKAIVNSFYGCTSGNINSPVWICGLEWGGGYDPEIPICVEADFQPYDFKDLQCWSPKEFWESFWAPRSRFCQAVIKVLLGLREGKYVAPSKWYWEEVAKPLIDPKGLALILNKYPISMDGRANGEKNWNTYRVHLKGKDNGSLSEWTRMNFNEYKEYVSEVRSSLFTQERMKRKPQLIVCFGMNDKLEQLFGVPENGKPIKRFSSKEGEERENGDCCLYAVDNGGDASSSTLILVTPFPSGAYGLNSEEKFISIVRVVSEEGKRRFKDKWLKVPVVSDVSKSDRDDYDRLRKLNEAVRKSVLASHRSLVATQSLLKEIKDSKKHAFITETPISKERIEEIQKTEEMQNNAYQALLSCFNTTARKVKELRDEMLKKVEKGDA